MSDDLIRRSDAIKELHDIWREFYSHKEGEDMDTECFCGGILTASHVIEAIPTIEPKRGKWIRHENSRYSYDREQGNINAGVYYTCSECNHISWTHNYCSNCGADMRGKGDDQ